MTGMINAAGGISGNFSLTVGSVVFLSGINYKETIITGNYTALTTDYIIASNLQSGVTGVIVLPSGSARGTSHVIKDNVGLATLNTFIISGQPNIDGASTFRLSDDYGSISVYKGISGWRII
jgi:hypothetical protein